MVVGQLPLPGRLRGHPGRDRVVDVPAHVLDEMREHVEEPAGAGRVDGVDLPQRPGGDDLPDLRVVFAVPVLVADDGLDPGGLHRLPDLQRLVHRQGDRLLVGDQLRAGGDPGLDQLQPDRGGGAETEDVGLHLAGEGEGVGGGLFDPQFGRRLLQHGRHDVGQPGDLESRVRLERGRVVLPPLAGADDDDFVDFAGHFGIPPSTGCRGGVTPPLRFMPVFHPSADPAVPAGGAG